MVEVYHITFFIYPNNTTMKEQVTEKRPYEAPQLTVVTFKTERGYADSNIFRLALASILLNEPNVSNSLESREAGGNWGGNETWY